jgi:hypothetical protein
MGYGVEIPIYINGKKIIMSNSTISYEELVAYVDDHHPTVTYGGLNSGILLPGQILKLESGMKINAYNTGSA